MILSLTSLIRKYQLEISGIIHIGAHWGGEYDGYIQNNIPKMVFIEPCDKAFAVLSANLGQKENVILLNCACGEVESKEIMFIETSNCGQSNSMMKPIIHLKQYPHITFDKTEVVNVKPLDSFGFTAYNMINMDVQGFELNVLKGAANTLKNINYVYTEINREEVYEGCARVEQIDDYLNEFKRVETEWLGGSWGDALYIRKSCLKS